MTPEQRHNHGHLRPRKELNEEMSLGASLRRLVYDLVTYQTVAENLQRLDADDALPTLAETWKRGLTKHLEETVYSSIDNVISILLLSESGKTTPISAIEHQKWATMTSWYTLSGCSR